jgi:hypothetical protein
MMFASHDHRREFSWSGGSITLVLGSSEMLYIPESDNRIVKKMIIDVFKRRIAGSQSKLEKY